MMRCDQKSFSISLHPADATKVSAGRERFRARRNRTAFTLIELILVMVIIAIIAGMLAPSLAKFTAGRAVDSTARRIVGLARYARTQAISEGRIYRLNFDSSGKQMWLTVEDGANYTSPTNDYGTKYEVPTAVTMAVTITSQPNLNLFLPDTVQQEQVQQPNTLLNGTQSGTTGSYLRNIHVGGQYIEFQPTGRTDPATIDLVDTQGNKSEVACASPSDLFSIVETGSASR